MPENHLVTMAEAADLRNVDSKLLFELLVNDYNSIVKLPNDQVCSAFPSGVDPVVYCKKNPKFFIVFENDAGKEVRVGARFKNFKLCNAYGVKGSYCNEEACTGIHCCRDWVAGDCEDGASCRKAHHFQSKHNKTVLEAFGFPRYREENLRNLLSVSLPQVCRDFNRNECDNDEACPRFHVCEQFLRGTCVKLLDEDHTDVTIPDNGTGKLHRFDSSHSKRLIKAYEMESCSQREIFDALALVRTRQENPLRIRQLIHNMRQDCEQLPDLEEPFTFQHVEQLFRPKAKAVTTKQTAVRELGEEEIHALQGDFENLRAALGDDDGELMDAFCYQLELESQKNQAFITDTDKPGPDVHLPTVGIALEPFHNPQVKEEELEQKVAPGPNADDPLGLGLHAQLPNPEDGLPGPNASVRSQDANRSNPVIAIYTGYAPQDDKVYICEDSIVNACPKDAETCDEAHYISPYLWQLQVARKWYNLDTVNEDVEKAHKQRDTDYITTMPQEVPELAGKLMTIFFKKMAAELTVAEEQLFVRQVRERYGIRRLQCRSANKPKTDQLSQIMQTLQCPDRKRLKFPMNYQKRVTPARPEEILPSHHVKPFPFIESPYHSRSIEKKYKDQMAAVDSSAEKKLKEIHESWKTLIPEVEPLVGTEILQESEQADVPGYLWQVKVNDTWLDLTSANREIEEAYSDRAPDYATMLPAEIIGGDERLIELRFTDMQAIFLDTNDAVPLRRNLAKPDDGHEILIPHDELEPQAKMRISRLKKFSALQKPEQTTSIIIDPNTVFHPEIKEKTVMVNEPDIEPFVSEDLVLDGRPCDEAQSSGQLQDPVEAPTHWQWSWSTDFKTWTLHDEEYSECLEAAYLSEKKTGTLKVNGEKVKIDFTSMVETTKQDNKTRLIKRHKKY